jgi:HSP20 family protein
MNSDDRDDPFGDIFDEIERMMGEMNGPDEGGTDTHIDVYEDDSVVRLVADLPGVDKSDLNLQCDGTTLTIRAHTGHREYDDRVRLPATVDEHSADATFNNGVLHVTFDRADESAAINVE